MELNDTRNPTTIDQTGLLRPVWSEMGSARTYSLDQILTLERRPVNTLEPTQLYQEIGVRSFGKGIFHKEPRTGFEVGNKKLYLIKDGDFIFQITFAWEGAVALATMAEDGMYGSVRFPTFRVNEDICVPKYLLYYFRTEQGRQQLGRISPGSAGRNRVLSLRRIPEVKIPLPPLDEQRRIVAYIEALSARVEEARRLRQEAVEVRKTLWAAEAHKVFSRLVTEHPLLRMGEVITIRNDLIRPTDGRVGELNFVGLQHIEPDTGRRIGHDVLLAETLKGRKFMFSPGEIVYGYLRPYLNKVWVADSEGVCSVDQYVLQPCKNTIDVRYLASFMRSPLFLHRANKLTHNLMLPRLRSGLLKSIEIPLPPLAEQRRIVAYLDELQARVNALRQLQTSTQAALDALMPSVLARAFGNE